MSAFVESLEGRQLLATHVVSTLADSGAGSLREAFEAARTGDIVDARGVTGTIALASSIAPMGDIINVRLLGPGIGELTIDASATSRAFEFTNSGVELANVKIVGSSAVRGEGGAIYAAGTLLAGQHFLTLTNCEIANSKGYARGGAIRTQGVTLTIFESYFHDNAVSDVRANAQRDSMARGGVIYADGGSLFINRSVFSNNLARGEANTDTGFTYADGGAIYKTGGQTQILDSTFYGNQARSYGNVDLESEPILARGGTLALQGGGSLSHVTVASSYSTVVVPGQGNTGRAGSTAVWLSSSEPGSFTIADSIIGMNNGPNAGTDLFIGNETAVVTGSLISMLGGETLARFADGSGSNQYFGAPNYLDPRFGTFGDHGGTLPSLPLQANSPAVRTGPAAAENVVDQRRYYARDLRDIGAFEYNASETAIVPGTPVFSVAPKAFVDRGATAGYMRGMADVLIGDVTYAWARLAKPENAADPVLAAPTARSTNVQFFKSGEYSFRLTATNREGESASRRLIFTVDAVTQHVHLVQGGETLRTAEPVRLQARIYDQFGGRISPAPATKWTLLEGEGRLTNTGLYTPADGVDYSRIRFRARADGIDGIGVSYIRAA